ncbi:MAG: STAS domain-containing protein [Deltaproteobacteria bacterium]|nr:STAS domain-containing protein [Deltaproteobacteria bacterium]
MQTPPREREPVAAGRFPATPRGIRRPAKIHFAGSLDAFTMKHEAARIAEVMAAEPREVILDLALVDRIDSAAVHAFVNLHKQLQARGGKVVVVNAGDQPRTVLKLLKLTTIFGL